MHRTFLHLAGILAMITGAHADPSSTQATDDGWVTLSGMPGLEPWRQPTGAWQVVADAELDPDNRRLLRPKPGSDARPGHEVLINGPRGKTDNLISKRTFGDVELHLEFLIPERSNSGVKLMGLYEIQISDSWGVQQPTGSDCGGIYPRAELEPRYRHIDKGVHPLKNACRRAGEWQTLDVVFHSPRFDPIGQKRSNAQFVKVMLNGQLIHEHVELSSPTGHAWHDQELPVGPLLLQADHGPVAFRNIRVRPVTSRPGDDQ